MSHQYCVTYQVSKVTRVKLLFESQFGPYICYFDNDFTHVTLLTSHVTQYHT